jgi:hypothetical protein
MTMIARRTSSPCGPPARPRSEVEPLLEREQAALEAVLLFGEAAQAVLDDDHRAVDDQAEVDRAEAHQVAADAALDHADGGDQHRQRDGERAISAARTLPSSRKSTTITSAAPSSEALAHRAIVASTSLVRFSTVRTRRPAAATADRPSARRPSSRPVRLFSPISIRAVPTTTSRPLAGRCRCAARGRAPRRRRRARRSAPSRVPRRSRSRRSLDAAAARIVHASPFARRTRPRGDVVALQRFDQVVKVSPYAAASPRIRLHVVLLHVAADRVDARDILHGCAAAGG